MDPLIRFWQFGARLKEEQRQGWVQSLRISRVESVADHSFAVALLGLFEGERRGYDMARILKLALIHDLEEAITGDLTPRDRRRRGEARVRMDRQKAAEEILSKMPVRARPLYRRLWTDLRTGGSREARLVRQLDKLEMAFQAHMYGRRVSPGKLLAFYRSAERIMTDRALKRTLAKMTRKVLD